MVLPIGFVYAQDKYPKLANYFLDYVSDDKYSELSKWDLLIFPTETAFSSGGFFNYYRQTNQDGIILSYIYPAMVNHNGLYDHVGLNRYLHDEVTKRDWWLHDDNGNKLEIWPGIYAVNITNPNWIEFNVNYIKNKIDIDKWDGIFFDIVDASVTHYNKNGGIDINNDGSNDSASYINTEWQKGMSDLFKKTRQEFGSSKYIIMNGNSISSYQPNVNGRMFETFPTPWEGNGTWQASMVNYMQNLPNKNKNPNLYVINTNTSNSGNYTNYQKMRFGLTSTLLGDGYFSFDHGDESHAQLWWYDEYDVNLGSSRSDAYNVYDKQNSTIKPSIWRRDFENGVSLVNSSNKEMTYILSKEEFEKINGNQDRRVNNGAIVNFVKIPANDGIILKSRKKEIKDSSFDNGSFVRVFDDAGKQVQNGFFSYIDRHPGNTQVLVTDLDGRGGDEILVNGGGLISIYQEGEMITSFEPYDMMFRGEVSIAVSDLNGDGTKEIITGAGAGGGPHVRIFSKEGRPLTGGFFAYGKDFRGGVNIAVMDLNGDGTREVITGAGAGGGPHIRVFTKDGRPLTGGFFAYDQSFRGGVTVATGNVDGKGDKEIITGAGPNDKPLVHVFSKDGKLKKEFMGYGEDVSTGIKVMSYDINDDNIDEILVSTISF